MPKLAAAKRREQKQQKAKHGMRVQNRSLKSVILRVIRQKEQA